MADAVSGLYAAVGAYACGKTTTLRYLAEEHGQRRHVEAHNTVLARLGARLDGHPPDQGFTAIDRPEHFCPMCRPLEFCDLVLAEQAAIEARAQPGDWIEHGWLDAVEYACRNAGLDALPPRPGRPQFAPYRRVFLFAVVPAVQRPRWGKSVAQRIAECERINRRIGALYRRHGMIVHEVPAAPVAERAQQIMALISAG